MEAASKFAFVAGCNAYQGTHPALSAAVNDVRSMSAMCKQHAFEVHSCSDVSYNGFQESLNHAALSVDESTKLVIFHWSGHATSENGRPVLHPIMGGPIDLAKIIQTFSAKASPTAATVVILDCCRDEQEKLKDAVNAMPYFTPQAREPMPDFTPQVREPGRRGNLCSFRQLLYIQACAPGRHASEEGGEGGHGYLTKAVLKHLFEEGSLADVLKKVRQQVLDDTGKKQDVWTSENCVDYLTTLGNPILYGDCCFRLARAASEHQKQLRKDVEEKCKADLREKLAEAKKEHQHEVAHLRDSHELENDKLKQELEQLRDGCAEEQLILNKEIVRLQEELMIGKHTPTWRRRTTSSSVGSSIVGTPSRSLSQVEGCLSTFLERSRKPWIAIDGLLGVGKSSLAKLFKEEVEPHMHVVCEPISDWNEQLELFYNDPKEHAFTTNMLLLQHHMKTADLTAASDPKRGVISERSPLSQVKIFGELAHEAGNLTEMQFNIMKAFLGQLQEKDPVCTPTHYVLLEADVETCVKRIRNRGRPYEQNANMRDFLVQVDVKLQDMYHGLEEKKKKGLPCGAEVIRISAKGSPSEIKQSFLEQLSHLWSSIRAGN